jgi:hypothetical protein
MWLTPSAGIFFTSDPGVWRVMFLVNEDASDERVQTREFAQSLMADVVPGISNYPIEHITLYKVHQRVAKTFRQDRVFLIGDAAHINNPLGGMGMNGGTFTMPSILQDDLPPCGGVRCQMPNSIALISSGVSLPLSTSRTTQSKIRRI